MLSIINHSTMIEFSYRLISLQIFAIDSLRLFWPNRQALKTSTRPIHEAWRHWGLTTGLRFRILLIPICLCLCVCMYAYGFVYQRPLGGSIRQTRARQNLLQPLASDCVTFNASTHTYTWYIWDVDKRESWFALPSPWRIIRQKRERERKRERGREKDEQARVTRDMIFLEGIANK